TGVLQDRRRRHGEVPRLGEHLGPDGAPRVLRHRDHRQPLPRHEGEGPGDVRLHGRAPRRLRRGSAQVRGRGDQLRLPGARLTPHHDGGGRMIGTAPNQTGTDALREELARLSRRSFFRGLVPGVSGNNSIRVPGTDTMVIKTSGCSQGDMTATDTVVMSFDGEVLEPGRTPSKEWRFHARIYATRPEVGAIAHL